MAVLDKDRPRGLRVPSLSSFRSKHKSPDPVPSIQLPSPSQLSLNADSLSFSSSKQQEKALPPQPVPSPPQHSSPLVVNPYPSPPQVHIPQPVPTQSLNPTQPYRNDAPPPRHVAPPANRPMPRPAPPSTAQPVRRPIPRSATAPAPVPTQASASGPVHAPVPVLPVNPILAQQRTPPSSESEPEQRHSNGTNDSLEGFIPDPEPELELGGTNGTPNEANSSEDDDRPFTPPEVEPVAVPLNKLHYSCYQDHRAMPVAGNVWYALPCMTCQKFDRKIRHRCVFCCLRVCADCFQALKNCPRRSLAQLIETISANGDAVNLPSATAI
ncbi:hypothetical protein BJX99DRAFT_229705 [Aspergillus californicus]